MRRTYNPAQLEDRLAKLSWAAVARLLRLAAPYKAILIAGGLLTLISSAVTLALPLVARRALDHVLATKAVHDLDRMALIIVGLIVVSAAIRFVQNILVMYAANRMTTTIRQDLFEHLQRLPVAYFDRTRSGDLASHLSNDVSLMQSTLTSDIVNLASNLATLFGGIAIAVYIDWKLTLVVVALLAFVMLNFVVFGRMLRKLTRAALDALSDAMGAMTEAMANIRLVKAFARERYEAERASEKLEKVYGLNMRSSVWESLMGSVAFVGFVLLLVGVMWFGGRNVISGGLSVGSLAAFFLTVTLISGPMGSLASLYTRLQRAVGAADRVFAIMDEQPEAPDSPLATEFPSGRASVTFEKVDFSYTGDLPVLAGFSLNIPEGKVTALVGKSGAGKTTVASLLFRLYEPQGGDILIDGVPIRNVKRDSLRENIGLVPQEPILFNGTIRENIRYGRLNASDAEVEKAADDANVREFVQGFPEGYETTVGERGITLSGGQRQRVAIARALLKDPRILVLDEATSSLDSRSETLVRQALDRLMKGRTTLVIAHRLTTVKNANQIAVVDDGRVSELGDHDELLARKGLYAELNNLLLAGMKYGFRT